MRKTMLLAAALVATNAGAAYKCVDEKGRTHFADTPPPGCANVQMYEITRSGVVIRTIEPSLTPEQVKAREAEKAKQKEAERAAAEQKRKDMALLQSFSSEKEFDVVRDRNIEPLTGRIRAGQDRLKELDQREKKLADEMEFYTAGKSKDKAREMPRYLLDQQASIKNERANIHKAIAGAEKEIDVIKAKFETDKKRWVELKTEGRSIATSAPAPK